MNWEAAGVIAEVVSAVAVVISLIYLAAQIRHGANINKATIRSQLTQATQHILEQLIAKSEISEKIASGEPLSIRERIEVSMLNRQTFRGYENYVYQRKLGLFDESEWAGVYATIADHFSLPSAQEDWRAYRHQFSGALQEHLDPLVPDLEDPSRRPPVTFTKPNVKVENST